MTEILALAFRLLFVVLGHLYPSQAERSAARTTRTTPTRHEESA